MLQTLENKDSMDGYATPNAEDFLRSFVTIRIRPPCPKA
jgi:hypothetical protein